MTLIYPRESNAAHAPRLSPEYKSTVKRAPAKPLIVMPHTLSELTGPVYGHETVREHDHDLTIQHKGEPLGERIIVHGHVRDEDVAYAAALSAAGVEVELHVTPGIWHAFESFAVDHPTSDIIRKRRTAWLRRVLGV